MANGQTVDGWQDVPGPSQGPADGWQDVPGPPAPDLDTQLHQAYDQRPLWRKVLGLEPTGLSPELQQHLNSQKGDAARQMASQLGGVYSGYKQGAISGLEMLPFMALGPAGAGVSQVVGGGGLGLAANMATQALGGASIAKAYGASTPAAAVTGVLGAAGPPIGAAVDVALPSAATMRQTAQRLYQTALKPSTTLSPAESETLVQTGLDHGIPVSKTGLVKLSGLIDDVNQKIADVIAGRPNVPIDPNAVALRANQIQPTFASQVNASQDLAALEASKSQFLAEQGARPAVPPSATGLVDEYGNPIMSGGTPAQPAPPMTAAAAQTMKQGTYRQLSGKAYGELQSASVEAQKALARGLKEELATQFPELSNLNATDSKLLDLQPVLEKAVARIGNHQVMGIGTPLAAAGVKAATGSGKIAAIAGIGKMVFDDPAVKSRLAISLARAGVPMPQALARIANFSRALAQSQISASDSASQETQ